MSYTRKQIILISEDTGERKEFTSINAAAVFLGTNFANVRSAAISAGTLRGWRVYESPDTIREHIKNLENQLRILENV